MDPIHPHPHLPTVPIARDDADNKSFSDDKKSHADSESAQHAVAPSSSQVPDEDAQAGVTTAEAVTLTWNRKWLWVAYASMWCLYLVRAFESNLTANLGAYIVSGFEEHSLIPVIGIVSGIMGAATAMPVAKMLNVWDRGYGFLVMILLSLIGLILSAATTNIYTYCAAQVFWSVGYTGAIFTVDIITTDTSSLRDRGLAYAFTSSPYLITAFAGPKAAEGFYARNWRWSYGAFAIILPFVAAPLFIALEYNKRKAIRAGTLVRSASRNVGKPLLEKVWTFVIEFDLPGVILLAGGLALFLIPFNIASSSSSDWRSPHIIAMLVVGLLMIVFFGIYERFLSPKPFASGSLLANRTLIGGCYLSFMYFIAASCWGAYFTSLLQVVFNVSLSEAGYISNTSDVVNSFWLLIVGYVIKRSGRFKWVLYFALPIYTLGEGLLIYFRHPGQSVGFVIMCQIFMSLGGGTMVIAEQVAVLAAASHNEAASAFAILSVFGNAGSAVGGAVSGAIWTHTFPNKLQEYLPAEALPDWETIYESLDTQLSYEVGSATRLAIARAYGEAQQWMVAAGTIFMGLAFISILLIRNVHLDKIEQVKGVLL
ncbi:siderophore iron transporter [Jaminaea rosea]|uniref:Siderophore iron transporter n=1 Tax=Jaminaea rosea TaxID=1569628 RepID=A0A316V0T5_9BASI|nr:siderophore iron transporter [Jaminaea rosea]PWN31156.1 siderophore iron transporter [Jaminaea rosea]